MTLRPLRELLFIIASAAIGAAILRLLVRAVGGAMGMEAAG